MPPVQKENFRKKLELIRPILVNDTTQSRENIAALYDINDGTFTELVKLFIYESDIRSALILTQIWTDIRPESAASFFHLAYVLDLLGRHPESLLAYRTAMKCDPDYPNLRLNLAAAIRHNGGALWEERELLENAVRKNFEDGLAWKNLCIARLRSFDLDGAITAGDNAVRLLPGQAAALSNYSLVLNEAGHWDGALTYAKAACEFAPNDASYRFNASILLLQRGNYELGWSEFESRWEGPHASHGRWPSFPKPRWTGETLSGKTLLIWGEQGMGDVLQFCRLIPAMARYVHGAGGRIEWNSYPQMGQLLQRSLGGYVDGFTSVGSVEQLPHYDYHLPLLSLPLVLGLRETTIPRSPYLSADETSTETWKTRLAEERRLKVGLTWTGSSNHARNQFRKVGCLRYAKHLKDIPGVVFYSLQPDAADEVSLAREEGLDIIDFTSEFKTFDDTAAFVSALDLVVSVCTSVAHLSGALGVPTWVLLDTNPYWVWQTNRVESPWYPNTTLYRQQKFGEWDAVLSRVALNLPHLAL